MLKNAQNSTTRDVKYFKFLAASYQSYGRKIQLKAIKTSVAALRLRPTCHDQLFKWSKLFCFGKLNQFYNSSTVAVNRFQMAPASGAKLAFRIVYGICYKLQNKSKYRLFAYPKLVKYLLLIQTRLQTFILISLYSRKARFGRHHRLNYTLKNPARHDNRKRKVGVDFADFVHITDFFTVYSGIWCLLW